jgi:hypothetical protein
VGAIPLRCHDKSPDCRKTRAFLTDARLVLFYNWQNRAFLTKSTSRIFDEKLTLAHKLKERSCRLRARAAQHGDRLYVLGSRERRIELERKTPILPAHGNVQKKQKTSNELAPSIIGRSGTAAKKLDWTITPLSGTTTDYIRLAMLLAHMEP